MTSPSAQKAAGEIAELAIDDWGNWPVDRCASIIQQAITEAVDAAVAPKPEPTEEWMAQHKIIIQSLAGMAQLCHPEGLEWHEEMVSREQMIKLLIRIKDAQVVIAESLRKHYTAPAEGWQWVPKEPTEEMIAASCKGPKMTLINEIISTYQVRTGTNLTELGGEITAMHEAYKAMLASAPKS